MLEPFHISMHVWRYEPHFTSLCAAYNPQCCNKLKVEFQINSSPHIIYIQNMCSLINISKDKT